MKINIRKIIFILFFPFLGCEEIEHGPQGNDGNIPDNVSNVNLSPINGGFDISYDLPSGKDVLYVKAEYVDSNGDSKELKSSSFSNNIQILGYGDTQEKTIQLYSVDRSENYSTGISVVGSPLISVVDLVAQSIAFSETFGGVKITWHNITKVTIILDLYAEDANGDLVIVETIYTEAEESVFAIRGRDPVAQKFKVIVRDTYNNQSDEVFPDTPDQKLTPYAETILDKSLWSAVRLNNDDPWTAWGGNPTKMWDEDPNLENWAHTNGQFANPTIITIDLGVEVELSRFRLNQRSSTNGNFVFSHANPLSFSVYGSLEIPGQDGNLDDWIKLLDASSKKPSGFPVGTNTEEDFELSWRGEDFEFPELVKIRYVRVAVHTTWGSKKEVHIRELTFWGQLN